MTRWWWKEPTEYARHVNRRPFRDCAERFVDWLRGRR